MPEPGWERTVHCIGDLHAGAITDVRMDAVSRDVAGLGAPALHVQVGDTTETGTAAQDEIALRFLERLPGPWVTALGNHDILRNERGWRTGRGCTGSRRRTSASTSTSSGWW